MVAAANQPKNIFNFVLLLNVYNRQKRKKNQFCGNVSPIDCSLNFLNSFSPNSEVTFQPQLLNSNDPEKRVPQIHFFRQLAETSNANIIDNANHLIAASKEKGDIGSIT